MCCKNTSFCCEAGIFVVDYATFDYADAEISSMKSFKKYRFPFSRCAATRLCYEQCLCCNSFHFYIKPQLLCYRASNLFVVIHSISTSNHNLDAPEKEKLLVVIHSFSTSNHNLVSLIVIIIIVVIHSISTSNHNTLSVTTRLVPL